MGLRKFHLIFLLAVFALAVVGVCTAVLFPFPPGKIRIYSGSAPLFSYTFKVGTGFAVSPGGLIVTTRHGITGCRKITVSTAARRAIPASIYLVSGDKDIGLLKIDASDIPFLSISDWSWSKGTLRSHTPISEVDATVLRTIEDRNVHLSVAGYPGQSTEASPFERQTRFAPKAMLSGSVWFPLIYGEFHRGESGSPVIDGSSQVVGMVFQAAEKGLDSKAGAPTATIITAALIREILSTVGYLPDFSKPVRDPAEAVYRVFCFD